MAVPGIARTGCQLEDPGRNASRITAAACNRHGRDMVVLHGSFQSVMYSFKCKGHPHCFLWWGEEAECKTYH